MLVDEVQEVLNVDAENIEPKPNLGDFSNANPDCILGVAKVGKRAIFHLDIEIIFNTNEFAMADENQPN